MTAPPVPPDSRPDPGTPEHSRAPEHSVEHPAAGGFCRVSIAAPTTRVDLALPTGIPVVALLPSVVQFADEEPFVPQGWALSRLDGTRLDPASTLGASGVREGELLVLHSGRETLGDPLYDDVVEVLGTDPDDGTWTRRDTRLACAALGSVALLGALWADVAVGGVLAGVLLAVLAGLLYGAGAALARAWSDLRAGTVLTVLAAVTGATAATVLLGPPFDAGHVLVAAAVVVLVSASAPTVLGGGEAVFVGPTVAGLFGLLGGVIAILAPQSASGPAAVAAAVALAATTAMPTLALRLSRIPRPVLPRTASDMAEIPGQLELERVQHRVRRARGLLSGLVCGCYVAAGAGMIVIASDTSSPWPGVLAAVLGLLVVLRARLFRRRAQVAAPMVTVAATIAAGSVAAAGVWSGRGGVLLGAVLPILLALAVVAGLFGVLGERGAANPRLARVLDIVETVLLLAVVPLVLAVWDVYSTLLHIRA